MFNVVYEYMRSEDKLVCETAAADSGASSSPSTAAETSACGAEMGSNSSRSVIADKAWLTADKGNDPVKDWTSDTEVRNNKYSSMWPASINQSKIAPCSYLSRHGLMSSS